MQNMNSWELILIILLQKLYCFQQLQEFVIKNLYNIQQGNICYPYGNDKCQIELYKTLIRLTTNHHFKLPPPLNYTILLLTKGGNSKIQEISQICSAGISDLNSFIHPYSATLQLPLDLEDLKIELKDNNVNKNKIEMLDDEESISSETNSDTEQINEINNSDKNEKLVHQNVVSDTNSTFMQTTNEEENITIQRDNVKKVTDNMASNINNSKVYVISAENTRNQDDIIVVSAPESVETENEKLGKNSQIVDSKIDNLSHLNTKNEYDTIEISDGNADEEKYMKNKDISKVMQVEDLSEEEMEVLRVEDVGQGEKMSLDVEEICGTFVDLVN